MAAEIEKTKGWGVMRVRKEKQARLKEVRRQLAYKEKRDLSDTGLLDEIMEEGLARRERKLRLQ